MELVGGVRGGGVVVGGKGVEVGKIVRRLMVVEGVKGVVSFHGLLRAPKGLKSHCKAKILALHGHDDPMVKPEEVADFEEEMTGSKVDWQIHIYGGTMHAFTNPQVNNPGFGTVYSPEAERRSLIAMKNFFTEVFSS